MRSKLFVPGSRPELFVKALLGQADAISIDLEDSVIESQKTVARKNVVEFLKSAQVLSSSKKIIVRCNSLSSMHFEKDIQAIIQPSIHIVNLPKVESVDDILTAVSLIESAEKTNNVTNLVGILANIESAKGVRMVAEIASAHPRVIGLQLGLNDLFDSLAMDRNDINSIHSIMLTVKIAAGEVNVFAYDGAFPDIKDEQGFCDEAKMAKRLGYLGKSCIHPSQVKLSNSVFSPSLKDIAFAQRVVTAAQKAESEGVGAFTLDGKMIDLPAILRAKSLVAIGKCLDDK